MAGLSIDDVRITAVTPQGHKPKAQDRPACPRLSHLVHKRGRGSCVLDSELWPERLRQLQSVSEVTCCWLRIETLPSYLQEGRQSSSYSNLWLFFFLKEEYNSSKCQPPSTTPCWWKSSPCIRVGEQKSIMLNFQSLSLHLRWAFHSQTSSPSLDSPSPPFPSHVVPGCSEHAQPQPVDNPTTSCSPGNPLTSFLLSPPLFAIRIRAQLCFHPQLKE